jgi:hypothetical protein
VGREKGQVMGASSLILLIGHPLLIRSFELFRLCMMVIRTMRGICIVWVIRAIRLIRVVGIIRVVCFFTGT